MTKFNENLNFDITKNSNCEEEKSKTKIVKKIKKINCDKTWKLKLSQNSQNSNCEKTQKHKLWQNSKTQMWKNQKIKLSQKN